MRKDSPPAAGSDLLHDTARLDRRNTVLAQIEAALLADRPETQTSSLPRTGTDPYNSGISKGIDKTTVWTSRRPR